MPLYEYKCESCNKTFEVLQKWNAEPLTKCLHCQGDVKKLVSVSSFQFKGSGWYVSDYKNKSDKAGTAPSEPKKSNAETVSASAEASTAPSTGVE